MNAMMRNTVYVVALLLMFLQGAAANDAEPYPQIRVTGEGVATLAPDMALLSLAVTREALSAVAAVEESSAAMGEVLAAMRKAGIAERDLQTEQFSIQPRYQREPQQADSDPTPPRIVGYTVSTALTVRVRELARLGTLIDMSVRLGVNQGGGIQFLNEDSSSALTEARTAAVQDALARARTLTSAANIGLGKIIEISEQSYQPRPMLMARAENVMADSSPISIAGGENSYRVTVSVVLGLEQ